MHEGLELESFASLQGRLFEVASPDGAAHPQELVECVAVSDRANPRTGRAPFSLLFQGAADLRLPQQIHHLRHAELGEIELFLVPIQPNDKGTLYEAVFN